MSIPSFRPPALIPVVMAAVLFIAGCSGGGGGGGDIPATAVKLSGVVMAPIGVVARLEHRGPVYALLDSLMRPADAAMLGLSVVPSATVELVQVDGDGNETGSLGSTTTDSTGHYLIALPSGVVLSPTILVRVQGSGVTMRAPAIQTEVDITPSTEWLLQKLKSEGALLTSLSNEDLLVLQSVIESFSVDSGGSVAETLTNLDTALGTLVTNEITAIQATATNPMPSLDGTTWKVSGNDLFVGNVSSTDGNGLWLAGQFINTLSNYTVSLTAQDTSTYTAQLSGTEDETSLFAHANGCYPVDTPPYVTNCTFQDYNNANDTSPFYDHQTVSDVSPTLHMFQLADGRLTISYPAEEYIEPGDIFAYVTPPYVETYMPMGSNGDAFAGIAAWPNLVYAVADGVADRNQLRGAAADIKPSSIIKVGSGLSNANANGQYGVVVLNHHVAYSGYRNHFVAHMLLTASGGAIGATNLDGVELGRSQDPYASLTGSPQAVAIDGGNYTVSPNGALELTLTSAADIPILAGQINPAGTFFSVGATQHAVVDSSEEVSNVMAFGVKVGTDAPVVAGKSYRFEAFSLEYGDGASNPAHVRGVHVASSTLTFGATGTDTVELAVNTQTLERANDYSGVIAGSELNQLVGGHYSVDVNGVVTITLDGTNGNGDVIHGYVSADNNSMIATDQLGDFTTGSSSAYAVGIAFGSCSINCQAL